MRRASLLSVALAGVAVVGAAVPAAAGTTEPGTPSSEGRAGAEFPITLEGALGEVTIESEPQRVLALTAADFDAVVGLGIEPLAVPSNDAGDPIDYPWLPAEAIEDREFLDVRADTELNIERIAELDPDVIVANGYWDLPTVYERLSEIAPVVHYDVAQNADAWAETTRTIGAALGRAAEADELVAATEQVIADAAAANAELAGATFNLIIARDAATVSILRTEVDAMGQFVAAFGLELSEFATSVEGDDAKVPLSGELLGELDADVIFVVGPPGIGDVLAESPVWSAIPAVQRGAVVVLERGRPDALALGFPTALNVAWLVGEIMPRLTEAVSAE